MHVRWIEIAIVQQLQRNDVNVVRTTMNKVLYGFWRALNVVSFRWEKSNGVDGGWEGNDFNMKNFSLTSSRKVSIFPLQRKFIARKKQKNFTHRHNMQQFFANFLSTSATNWISTWMKSEKWKLCSIEKYLEAFN